MTELQTALWSVSDQVQVAAPRDDRVRNERTLAVEHAVSVSVHSL